MELNFSSSYFPISPSSIIKEGYELEDSNLIPNEEIVSSFIPNKNILELHVYDINNNLINSNYNFKDWRVINNSNTKEELASNEISLDPIQDSINLGYVADTYSLVYNFINYELNSSFQNLYYISEISSDRREIRITSNYIENDIILKSFKDLQNKLSNPDHFDEFYVSFKGNKFFIGINLDIDTSSPQYSILIKLYSPLPNEYDLKSECYITTKVGESKAFKTSFIIDSSNYINNVKYLQGPNTNLELKDFINNSSELLSKNDLLQTNSTSSKNHLINILDQKGVKISPNYSYDTFHEFIHFSSAKSRINNFIEKLSNIQSYEDDINSLSQITGSTSESFQVSSSISKLNYNIETVIKNFDGYEYYLYYNTSSLSYPKVGSSFPYTPLPVDDPTVLNWLGSDLENSQYYGGILLSASRFDENNPHWLYYTIPDFIKENSVNEPYIDFCNMVGQHFDYIWLYTKNITEMVNTTNVLDKGIPLKLAETAISSLGYKGFGNNYNNQNNFIGLTGENNNSYVPPTGSELITEYIAVNGGDIVNYWASDYSYINYVEQLLSPGWPYAIDDVSKEIFKRLYHNMSYLLKKKGTISGLRQLINIWGIPNTILRINEFGGKNRDNINDYDLYYNRYNYAYSPISNQNEASSSIRIPWLPLNRNYINDEEFIVPDTIQFRFKTTGFPSSSYTGEFYSQSLLLKKSNGSNDTNFDFGISLYYTGSLSSSYSGSNNSEYRDWGIIKFSFLGSSGSIVESDEIYLPFYNKEWWSVQFSRNQHVSASDNSQNTTYTLFVKNKPTDFSNNGIKFQGSCSLTTSSSIINNSWNSFNNSIFDGIYLGGYVSGSIIGDKILSLPGKILSGSLQEFRYYSNPIDEFIFNDYVMDPESIEGLNSSSLLSSFDIVNFRAPLGNELENLFTTNQSSSYTESLTSFHPASLNNISELITSSFIDPNTLITSSNYEVIYYENSTFRTYSTPNTETYFLDQPAIGLRNRINNKIQIDQSLDYGDILSSQRSISQNYVISQSYTENNNYLEVAFSPQNEINDDIIHTFGFNNISNLLGDPSNFYNSSSYYPKLRSIADDYFKKYSNGNIQDYLRLIKYFDNSLFKAIKNYVPLKTSVSTGIVIKQHILERNKYTPSKPNFNTEVAKTTTSSFNTPLFLQNLELESNIVLDSITGSTGGVFNKYNYINSPNFHQTPITQSWSNDILTILGSQTILENKQREFYDGELSGSNIQTINETLLTNPYKTPLLIESLYNTNIINLPLYSYVKNTSGSINIELKTLNSQLETINISDYNLPSGVSSSVFLLRPNPTSSNLFIQGIIISTDQFDSGSNITGWSEIASEPYGYYPTSSYVYGDTYKDVYPRPAYFQLKLPPSLTGSISAAKDALSGDTPWNIILSSGLNVKSTGINSQGHRWIMFYNGTTTTNRTILGSPGFGWGDTYQYTCSFNDFIFSSPTKGLDRYNISNILYDYSIPPTGSATLEFFPKTFYRTSSFEEYSPLNIVFNYIDANNNFNKNTLLSNPYFKTELSSSYNFLDSYGLPSTLIDKNYLSIVNYINYNQLNSTLFQFAPNGRTNPQLFASSSIFYFNPELLANINFENSDYNVLLNNYNENRHSSKYMVVDYSYDIYNPINLQSIISNTADKAQTPDSNYSINKNLLSKYTGTKLKSLDYTFYTPSGSVNPLITLSQTQSVSPPVAFSFLNGDTGSWGGDISYGKTSVIEKNPIYMAHFTSYTLNPTYWGTRQYVLDQLIFLPNSPILEKGYEPISIQLKGLGKNIYEISSNFEKSRNVEIYYGDNNQIIPSSNGLNKIINSGVIYKSINSNQLNEISSSLNWHYDIFNTLKITGSNSSNTVLLTTGSNYLQLSGSLIPPFLFKKSTNIYPTSSSSGSIGLGGPYLGVLHTYNQLLANDIRFSSESFATASLGITGSLGVSPSLNSSLVSDYFLWNSFSSSLQGYNNLNEPFLIKRGDEIRVTYTLTGNTTSPTQTATQIFTVTRVFGREIQAGSSENNYSYVNNDITLPSGALMITPIFDRIEVTPNPATLQKPIPNGSIYSFTIRRIVPSDNNLLISIPDDELNIINASTTSSLLRGANLSNSTQGFLIPSDLSQTQQQNALNIINQLKSKNVFKN